MALNIAGLAAELKTEIEAEFGPADSSIVLTKWCNAVSRAVINHIKNNADIELQNADISVLPGTFKDSLSLPVTGAGINDAVTLSNKIK